MFCKGGSVVFSFFGNAQKNVFLVQPTGKPSSSRTAGVGGGGAGESDRLTKSHLLSGQGSMRRPRSTSYWGPGCVCLRFFVAFPFVIGKTGGKLPHEQCCGTRRDKSRFEWGQKLELIQTPANRREPQLLTFSSKRQRGQQIKHPFPTPPRLSNHFAPSAIQTPVRSNWPLCRATGTVDM